MAEILKKPRDVVQVFKDLMAVIVSMYGLGHVSKFQYLAGTGAMELLKEHMASSIEKDTGIKYTDEDRQKVKDNMIMGYQGMDILCSEQISEYTVAVVKVVGSMPITAGLPEEG